MADAAKHQIGAFVADLVYWFISIWIGNIGLFLVSWIAAGLGGLAPDILEPPTWPGHRGLWHYIVGFLAVLPAIFMLKSNEFGFVIGAFCIGYFSHFVLDMVT